MNRLNRIKATWIFLCIFGVYIMGFFVHAIYLHKTVYGDGVYYYSWLRSVIEDHDINFSNEYIRLDGAQPAIRTGIPGNKYSVGPAILWTPVYTEIRNVIRGDGYALPYQLSVGLTSVLAALFALVLLFHILCRYFSQKISIMVIAVLAGATNLLFYGSVDAVNSHALSFFTAVVFLALLLSNRKQWFAIGFALGFLGLIRTQDLVYGIFLLPFLKKNNVMKIVAGITIPYLPQLLAWQVLYGKFWISPYLTGAEGFHFLSPNILGVLFGVGSGLFLWTPVTVLGIAGLFTGSLNRIPMRIRMIAVFTLEVYLVSSWSTWWQGASFSGRMFVSSLPIMAFGIASVFSWLSKFRFTQAYYLLIFVIPLSLLNALSIVYFLALPHGR